MQNQISEIVTMDDAKKVSAMIVSSLDSPEISFNPYQNKIFKHNNNTIRFMGKTLSTETAIIEIARQIWKDKRRINREIKKWRMLGPHVVNCGC